MSPGPVEADVTNASNRSLSLVPAPDERASATSASEVTGEIMAATTTAPSADKTFAAVTSQLNEGGSTSSVPATTAAAASAPPVPALVIRASGTRAAGVWPQMVVRVDGNVIGTVDVASADLASYSFEAPLLGAGNQVDVVFTNDALINGEERNLYVAYVAQGSQVVLPAVASAVYDRGTGSKAFDGLNTLPGQSRLIANGALRLTWPSVAGPDAKLARRQDAVRFLNQATFGATPAGVNSLVSKSYSAWLNEQMVLPAAPDFVNAVQAQYDRGDAYRPKGAYYSNGVISQKFWETATQAADPLRKRVAFAWHQILTVSMQDSRFWTHQRAYAAYLDLLNKNAFGNFRTMLEDLALSPAMGIYLSHMRNRREDAATGRMPDENFAREIMQLFSIGLHELNIDGTAVLDASGNPVDTYSNDDVMALAKVFTGWSWAFPDSELTERNFRWRNLDYSTAGDQRIDLLPMKPYPGQHSTAAKPLFAGKPWAVTIPANGSAQSDLKQALDALFNHPNVGPFIGRRLIQRLVTSQPSRAYVARVAGVFNDNGKGVRGDLGAVVRAVLLDGEARRAPPAGAGKKLREPVLRVTQWMRALGATSASGKYFLTTALDGVNQRALFAPSVFGDFRSGYVPPNTVFATNRWTAPEFQIVDESTVAAWINTAEAMAGDGLGWSNNGPDVSVDFAALGALDESRGLGNLIDHLNLLLLGGRMSAPLRQAILDAASNAVGGTAAPSNRARAAVFMILASPEYLTQP